MTQTTTQLFILKTSIESENNLKRLFSLFTFCPEIYDWSVDLEDIDKVLRVETSENIELVAIKELLQIINIRCEELPD